MKSTGQEREIHGNQADERSVIPAIVACVTCMGGTLGAVMIAAGPWLALNWYW